MTTADAVETIKNLRHRADQLAAEDDGEQARRTVKQWQTEANQLEEQLHAARRAEESPPPASKAKPAAKS